MPATPKYKGQSMPVLDRREIEFDPEALIAAVSVSLRSAQAFGLPAMRPTGVRCYPRDGQVDFLYGSKGAPQAVRIDAEPLGALLVAYCIRARIPMPRHADKGVRIEANSVILAFRMEYSETPSPEAADTANRAPVSIKAWGWIEPEKVPAR
jgi:hypothetical protein